MMNTHVNGSQSLKMAYAPPEVEVVEMECEACVMTGSEVGGTAPDIPFQSASYDAELFQQIESLTETLSE